VPESGKLDANKRLVAQNVSAEMSKATRKKMAAEIQVDATVFEYDEVWDKMQEAKARQKERQEVDSKERKVRRSIISFYTGTPNEYTNSLNTSPVCSILPRLVDWII